MEFYINYKKEKMIIVVYHCYLINNWQEVVTQQLARLKNSGLYDVADSIYVTINAEKKEQEKFVTLTKKYKKLQIEFFESNNYEHPGISKVKELGLSKECKIFYFHTKGVSNTYKKYENRASEICEEKIENIIHWKECLEYFLIDKWKESVEKLETFDNVGVTCVNGWFCGNFWWSQSNHIKKTTNVTYGSRWDYEAWLNRDIHDAKNFEWYPFSFDPYTTKIDPVWYNEEKKYARKKIVLISAFYGTPDFEVDEGFVNSTLSVRADVTNEVRKLLEKEDNLQFNFVVSNENMGSDPIYLNKKFLFLEFSPEGCLDVKYKMGVREYTNLNFRF